MKTIHVTPTRDGVRRFCVDHDDVANSLFHTTDVKLRRPRDSLFVKALDLVDPWLGVCLLTSIFSPSRAPFFFHYRQILKAAFQC